MNRSSEPRPPVGVRSVGDPAGRFDLPLALLLAAVAGLAQAWLVAPLRQLPGPLFGGDYAYQEGCVRSVLASGDPMASCSCVGALPGYLPLYSALVAAVVRLSGLPVVSIMLWMSVATHVISTLAVAFVIGRHFGRRAGLIVASLWTAMTVYPTVKYTEFTMQALIPFFYDALLLFLASPRLRRAAYLGIVLAVLGYTHAVAFTAAVMVTGIAGIATAAARVAVGAGGRTIAEHARGLAVAGGLAALALGYWYRPLFVHGGRTSAHYVEWNGGVLLQTFGQRLDYAAGVFAPLGRLDASPDTLLHLLGFAGVATLVLWPGRRRFLPVAVAVAATGLWMLHFFVTMPLLGTHFVPEYVRSMLWSFGLFLVAAIAVNRAVARLEGRRLGNAAALAAVALGVAAVGLQAPAIARRDAMVAAREALPPEYLALQRWVLEHTRPDDVVLSTNELSFAWSALTGRKTLVSRRAQNDAFLDLDERNRDAALILYGNDDAARRRLLARWGVDYVLWTHHWSDSEYQVDEAGRVQVVDPLLVFANADVEARWSRAGVRFVRSNTWIDPGMRGPRIPKFDVSLVTRENYEPRILPWRRALDAVLEEAWSYPDSGPKQVGLFRVRQPLASPDVSGDPAAAAPERR